MSKGASPEPNRIFASKPPFGHFRAGPKVTHSGASSPGREKEKTAGVYTLAVSVGVSVKAREEIIIGAMVDLPQLHKHAGPDIQFT